MESAQSVSKLGLDIETQGLVRGVRVLGDVARASDRAAASATRMEKASERQARAMSAMSGIASSLQGQFAAILGIWSLIRANDTWVGATNQLRLVTDNARELRDVTQDVFDLAQRTASRFEGTAGLFASIQRAAGSTIGSQREVLRLTETIMKLTAAGGGPEGSRNSALFQLRQAMGGSVLQAQEFNSLLDGAPLLVQAIADSFGVTRGELRKMVNDQQVQISELISGLQGYADEADALFARAQFTVGDALIRLQNAFQKLVGTQLGPLFSGLVNGVWVLADNLDMLIPILSGVGVAFALAFAPTAIEMMTVAVGALFSLIARHPFTILAAVIVGAVVAMQRFGDQVVVAQTAMKGFSKTVTDEGDKAGKSLGQSIDVTLKDYVDEALALAGQAVATVARDISTAWSNASQANVRTSEEANADIVSGFRDMANWLIGALRTVYDYAKMIFPQLGDFILLAIGKAGQSITDLVIKPLNAARELMGMDPVEISTFQELDGIWARIQQRAADFNATMASNMSHDYMADLDRGAAARAQARQESAEAAQEEAAAVQAAAAGNAALARKIQDQADARRAMFADLEAQLVMGEREYELYAATEDLLKKFPDYYAAMGTDARALATEDAKRLTTLQRQAEVLEQQRQLARDTEEARGLAAAAGVSADEYDLVERTYDLMSRFPALYDRLEASSFNRARAEASSQLALERQTEQMRRQADRARDLARAPAENLVKGLEEATDDFWTNFVERGFGAFDDLGDALKNVFRRLQADILRSVFEPMLQGIRGGISQGMSGAGFGGAQSFGSNMGSGFAQSVSQLFAQRAQSGSASLAAIATPQTTAGAAGQVSGVLGSLTQGISGLFQKGGMLANVFSRAFSPGGVIGSTIGSGLAGLVGLGDGKYSGIGGTLGGIAGAFFGGPIGSAIGSFLGSALGKLLGGKESNHAATLGISQSGQINPTYDAKAVAETISGVEAAAARITEGQNLLKEMGATLKTWVSGLQLGQRDQSWFSTNGLTAEQGTRTGSIGDPEDLVKDALGRVLRDAVFDNSVLTDVKNSMLGAGKSFESTLEVLGALKQILPQTDAATTQWGKALEALETTFDGLRESAAGAAVAIGEIDKAFLDAKATLRDQFQKSIADAITGIESPVKLQFEELLKTQTDRMADARDVGVDWGQYVRDNHDMLAWFQQHGTGSIDDYGKQHYETYGPGEGRQYGALAGLDQVMKLNALELKAFIEQAGKSADAFEGLSAVFDELMAKAQAAGQATGPLIEAFNQARGAVTSAFDDSVADQLSQLTNPTLYALKQLLDAQKSRLEQARDLGASIIGVERLNAAEQRAFFENLSDEQKNSLGEYLGLIENFTGRITIVLSKLGDELQQRIDDTDAMHSDLMKRADDMRSLSDAIGDQRQNFADRYGAATPKAGVDALRDRFANLGREGLGGNESALQALPQVAQQLIDQSRALYGSTGTFRADYDMVQAVLGQVEQFTGGRADALESEADTLIAQRDLLIEIRDILGQPNPEFDDLSVLLGELNSSNDVVAALLAQYLQLAAAEAGQNLDLGQLYAQAAAAAAPTSAAVVTQPTGATSTPAPQPVSDQSDHTASMMAVQIDVLKEGFDKLVEETEGLRRDFRNLNTTLTKAA